MRDRFACSLQCRRYPGTNERELTILPVRGVDLAVWEWPGDGPTFLFAHATGFHARCWDEVIRGLPRGRAIAMDMRGHGRSDKPAPPYRWREFGEDVAELAKLLELRDVVGVGHSMGGHSMALAAALRPEAFSSLILVDPTIFQREYYGLPQRHDSSYIRKRRNHWASPEECSRDSAIGRRLRDGASKCSGTTANMECCCREIGMCWRARRISKHPFTANRTRRTQISIRHWARSKFPLQWCGEAFRGIRKSSIWRHTTQCYAGIRRMVGGNCKNFTCHYMHYTYLIIPFAFEGASGQFLISGAVGSHALDTIILCPTGTLRPSCHCRTRASLRQWGSGTNPASATFIGCVLASAAPTADDEMIIYSGQLTLINCFLDNHRVVGTTLPRS